MKSLKKTLVLLVVLSMLLSAISPVFAANYFADDAEIAEAYWEHANKLAAVGVIAGDENGNFNAEDTITRAEMAVIICKMAGMTEATANASKNIQSVFTDVPAGEWFTGWINLAVDNGMIAGFPDGTFRPHDPLTTNQAITLVVKALGKGEYVDQMGTWPGNYVQEAAKLGLTREMVDTNSDLAVRGNVAILAWEALQVGTWDVQSTTLDGEVRLSEADSLLVKYFKDFVAGTAKNKDFRVKLVEDAVVTKVGRTTSALGANQIVLEVAEDGTTKFDGNKTTSSLAEYIDAKDEPKKGAKEATYVYDEQEGSVVAYVPAEVADVDGFINKKVDVLFGADNEVALIYVTDDVVDEAYVTAWDKENSKITIAGKTYKVIDDVEVSVFDYVAEATITEIVEDVIKVADNKNIFNRVLKAEFSLDSKDRIEEINFTFSADVETAITTADGDLTVLEDVVKKVTSAGVIKGFSGNLFDSKEVEDLMDEEEIRVIKDGAVADFDEIVEGDVLTIISLDDEATLVYASSTKVSGEAARGKNNTLSIDGDKYNTVLLPLTNIDGEFDDMEEVADRDDIYEFVGEEVELYLNFMGEIVGAVGTSDATGTVLGVVTGKTTLKFDDDDVEYMSVRILTVDGKKVSYKIYNEDKGEDISDADEATSNAYADVEIAWAEDGIPEGTLVVFEADSNRKIWSDEIRVPASQDDASEVIKEDFASNSDVEVTTVAYDDLVGDENKNLLADITLADGTTTKDLKVNGSTIYLNVDSDPDDGDEKKETEIVKNGWAALINSDDEIAPIVDGTIYIFYKGTKVIYFVADFEDYQASDAEYAVVTDISIIENTDEDKVWEVTLYQEGETLVYELDDEDLREDIHEGDFVEYTFSDDVIQTIDTMVYYMAMKDLTDEKEIDADWLQDATKATILNDDAEVKGQLIVDSIDEGWLVFSDAEDVDGDDAGDQIADVELCEDGYIIYDLTKITPEMIENINDIIGSYVVAIELTDDEGAEIIVVIK